MLNNLKFGKDEKVRARSLPWKENQILTGKHLLAIHGVLRTRTNRRWGAGGGGDGERDGEILRCIKGDSFLCISRQERSHDSGFCSVKSSFSLTDSFWFRDLRPVWDVQVIQISLLLPAPRVWFWYQYGSDFLQQWRGCVVRRSAVSLLSSPECL